MSAIPAASVSLKTMADGTLRMTFDIEPAQAKDAFSLFAAPGTPVAIAALKNGYAAMSTEPDPGLNPMLNSEPVGPLCKWLVLRCKEPEFWAFLGDRFQLGSATPTSESACTERVKGLLMIKSRKELDTDDCLASDFHSEIRQPYQKWLVRRQG